MMILQVLLYLVWGSFTALRVYALHTNWFLPSIILLLYAVSAGINMSKFAYGLSGVNLPLLGCQPVENMPINIVKLCMLWCHFAICFSLRHIVRQLPSYLVHA
ncbi:hypothetical protein LXA43DRAFT_378595 [Ganoderma leucocontextum]|nr:hypothetical protein LXA43DRAFT_378595 [Ganoderma leucocontextum]